LPSRSLLNSKSVRILSADGRILVPDTYTSYNQDGAAVL
jgi:hypothetical protein